VPSFAIAEPEQCCLQALVGLVVAEHRLHDLVHQGRLGRHLGIDALLGYCLLNPQRAQRVMRSVRVPLREQERN